MNKKVECLFFFRYNQSILIKMQTTQQSRIFDFKPQNRVEEEKGEKQFFISLLNLPQDVKEPEFEAVL